LENFDFELQHDLTLTIVWKYPPESKDEEQYRRNIEMAVQEMALIVQIHSEELAKPIVAKMIQKTKELWESLNGS